uniref:G-protein coupled receptors family 1 profile domain-containing protein n=1 Tax=Panagrolaimus sp. ES5 TaxID=591445 RepID=A0AC34GQL7_9BILA
MLWFAWVAAFIISAPQFAIWRSYLAFKEINWSQCMQIWEILRAEASMNNSTEINYYTLLYEENIYVVIHMLLIFWIPATIVLLCYLVVSCWVYFNSKPLAFSIEHARNSTCGTAIMSSSRIRIGTRTTALTGSTADNRNGNGGVSYHTGLDTVETIISKPAGVHFAANPKIIISDEAMQPLTEHRGSTSSSITLQTPMPTISNSITYGAKRNRSRAIRVSFLLVAAYIICWLPYNALGLIQFIDPETFSKHANKVYCLHGMMVFNSVVNPYLYGLFGGVCRPKRRDLH